MTRYYEDGIRWHTYADNPERLAQLSDTEVQRAMKATTRARVAAWADGNHEARLVLKDAAIKLAAEETRRGLR